GSDALGRTSPDPPGRGRLEALRAEPIAGSGGLRPLWMGGRDHPLVDLNVTLLEVLAAFQTTSTPSLTLSIPPGGGLHHAPWHRPGSCHLLARRRGLSRVRLRRGPALGPHRCAGSRRDSRRRPVRQLPLGEYAQ